MQAKNWKWPCLAAVLALFAAQAAMASDSGQQSNTAAPCMSATVLCCRADYCRKPMPCVPCPQTSCCPDNYCRKPLPCVPCPQTSCCPDNYCRKPLPCVTPSSLCSPPSVGKRCCGRGSKD